MIRADLKLVSRGSVPGATVRAVENTYLEKVLELAIVDITAHSKCLPTSGTFDVDADESEYQISDEISDYLCIGKSGLWWNRGDNTTSDWKKLIPRTRQWLDENKPSWKDLSSGDPLYYFIEGDTITVHPTPKTDLTGGFKIYYVENPNEMTADTHYPFYGDTTEYPFLKIFDICIIEYAKWRMLDALNKKQEALQAFQSYLGLLNKQTNLLRSNPDISAHKDTKFSGRKIRG